VHGHPHTTASVEVLTPPAEEPVSLSEAKEHLRVDISSEDSLIQRLIVDAREWTERYTRRRLVTQTLRMTLDDFPRLQSEHDYAVKLPGGRVQSITQVRYLGTDGTLTTLNSSLYVLLGRDQDRVARIVPSYDTSWPATRDFPEAVQVDYVCGYGAASAVPASIRQAMLLHVGWHFENREPGSFGAMPAGSFDQFRGALELKLADYRSYEFA
jgi:uncharacterized phiE125 gp8 family phage protein